MKREELLRILRDEETEVENRELLLSIFSTYGWSYYEGVHVFAHGESQSSRFSSHTGLPTGKLVRQAYACTTVSASAPLRPHTHSQS